jgi:hypothetical protein
MTKLRTSTPFVYDDNDDIIGLRDLDGGQKFLETYAFPVLAYGSYARTALVTAASTFTGLTYDEDDGLVRFNSDGAHGLTEAVAVGKHVYVSWTEGEGPGAGVDGFYTVVALDDDTTGTAITIDMPYVEDMGTPTVALAGTEVTLALASLPANALQVGRILEFDALFGMTGSTNNKVLKAKLGDQTWYNQTVAGNNQSVCLEKKACASATNTVISNAAASPGHGASTGANVSLTVTFNAALTFAITVTPATANEFVEITAWKLRIL